MLPVNEIFQTVQGEAAYTGTPATFIRLQGCPIGCPWCDTKHTWELNDTQVIASDTMQQKQDDASTYARMGETDLLDAALSHDARHIVLTGGEPCLYDLTRLTGLLIGEGFSVQIETSGTQPIKCHPDAWVTVSPKIGMPGGYEVLSEAFNRADEIKWPVGKQADVDRLDKWCRDYHGTVWLQPLSQSPKATRLCVDAATQRGHRISIQTHKYLGVR